jgi:perosamine synthetase
MDDNDDSIPLFEIDWNETDISNVTDSLKRGGYWSKGPYVDEFESKLAQYLEVNHALVVNSGTTALVAALKALNIGEGDEVIVPSFTFIATANAVRLTGAEPVFADIDKQTYGLDPSDVESQTTDATAGILPAHLYGTSCQIEELASVADNYGVPLIEDAAEALGAEYNEQKLGTFGDVAALSFCQNKITPTGEGGAVVTDDDKIANAVQLYRSHGRASSDYFNSTDSGQYTDLGTNIRMSDLTAALGCSQMDRIESLIRGRRQAAAQLSTGLTEIDGIRPHQPLKEATHVYQLYTIELMEGIDRNRVIEELDKDGITSKVYWDTPVHQTEYYRRTKQSTPTLPVTEDIADRVLSLPMHPNLSSEETDRIIAAVEGAVR